MSLYLCVFDGPDEIEGVEVGPYADFNALRDTIAGQLEGGKAGSRFPTLMLHSDCDGEWDLDACARLKTELDTIVAEARLRPASAIERFLDVDGQFLLERLQGLVETALRSRQPILFQ
jgi:Immunity protein 70